MRDQIELCATWFAQAEGTPAQPDNIIGALRLLHARNEAAQAERERFMCEARKKGKQLDPRSLIAAEYVMLATSLTESAYPASEILALYRLRWQIELAFKRLKTLLRIDCLPAKTDRGGRSWIYAHLILAIATDACSQDFLDSSP